MEQSMSLIQKPWGCKIPIFESENVIVDHLFILPGGYSSIHQHKFLHNRFYVIDPDKRLEIQVFEITDGKANPVDHVTVSFENNSIAVPPKIWHRFRNPDEKQEIQVIEISYLAGISIEDDIFRVPSFQKGGFSE
jgi:mannose-6-phosphate isomerase-like protein (cupin superfamily)